MKGKARREFISLPREARGTRVELLDKQLTLAAVRTPAPGDDGGTRSGECGGGGDDGGTRSGERGGKGTTVACAQMSVGGRGGRWHAFR